jgi:hypothetical protein
MSAKRIVIIGDDPQICEVRPNSGSGQNHHMDYRKLWKILYSFTGSKKKTVAKV